jgi:hypothetical protein
MMPVREDTPPAAAVRVTYLGERTQAQPDVSPFHRWTFPDGTLWALFHRQGDHYLLRFPGLADFEIGADGREVRAWRAPGASQPAVEHLFLNQAEPLALGRQGQFVLHASAVDLGGYAVAFLGASGRGKSTLAASFALAGARFLTDDGLRLRWEGADLIARPAHPSIRLWQDSQEALAATADVAPALEYTAKARLLAGESLPHATQPLPVRAFYFLGDGQAGAPHIGAVRPAAAAAELVRNSFVLDIEEREMLARHFDAIARIAALPRHFHLDYPRRYDALHAVRDAVTRHAATLPP